MKSPSRTQHVVANMGHPRPPAVQATPPASFAQGTVTLTQGAIVYIPTPTLDPQDPLNMEPWQKFVVTVVVSIFSTLGLSLISGFAGLLGFYAPQYIAEGKDYVDITRLLTYPTLLMGFGNLIGMPIAIAVGRRIVLLASTLLLLISAIYCALAATYEQHLAARMLLGLAAGQSESIVPMIIQEIHFLHERSRVLMVQQTIQVIASSIWVICASPIAGAVSPQWWYGLGAALSATQLLISIFLLPETKYERAPTNPELDQATEDDSRVPTAVAITTPLLGTQADFLDYNKYDARTWKSDMRLWIGEPEWPEVGVVLKQVCEILWCPDILLTCCISGFTLGVNIVILSTYGLIISSPPYNWADTSVSYITCGNIAVALISLPLLGHGSDKLIQFKALRNSGVHEPETRLIPLVLPICVGIFTAVIYGQGASHPERYHWFLYFWSVAAYFFTFLGANIVSLTYLLDSYPGQAAPVLIIVSTLRGFLSFAVSNFSASFIQSVGYAATFTAFGIVTGVLGLLAIPLYHFGKALRTSRARQKHLSL